jgi:lipoprotein NlpD
MTHRLPALRGLLLAGTALAFLSACQETALDWDLRDLGGNTLDTTASIQRIPIRPEPDARGVISYPTYQVAVARRGDTVRTIAERLSIDPVTLGKYNGISPDAALRDGEIIALPVRVEGQLTTGFTSAGGVDVTSLASSAIERAGPQQSGISETTLDSPAAAAPTGVEPLRHQVKRGETAYIISRLYGIPVQDLAEWNGLDADFTVREGQFLLIPQGSATPSPQNRPTTSQPGTGTLTPTPPSASTPLPSETTPTAPVATPPAPDLGQTAASDAPFIYPVTGSIIRAYSKGRNDGIDIGAPVGTAVKAAAAGSVAAITKDTNGVAIVVIRHANNLLTVYTNLDNLAVEKGAEVTQGQTIGKVRAGNPSFLHFEVRQGLESVDPTSYLP